jgi:hypothetical protein
LSLLAQQTAFNDTPQKEAREGALEYLFPNEGEIVETAHGSIQRPCIIMLKIKQANQQQN